MAKKNFEKINTNRGQAGSDVLKKLDQGAGKKGQQGTASEEEREERLREMRTQGRKGCEAVRINMAFSTDNYNFVKIMARANGETMTHFTNRIIATYRQEHPELLEQANAFIDAVNTTVNTSLTDDKSLDKNEKAE